ncbi:MAG: hypothetical protein A3F73_11000 [Gallionellales bacterium RIFCSPLOWO2_12_FULL_59_22]|nr:MAG: hypothetical protein A3H99_01890 [Gallionellales bacterium RIFCSPLOWO2_02_FULL_59_110]OGT14056.1 MAG: hypothetical protein A3F73_11000 [Gallionellales bacterium RIFCSPLOWO2_12_FULL_59_22]
MNTISSISIYGMNVAQTRLQAAAHNIANLNTAGFHRQEVKQSALAEGGTRAVVGTTFSAGSNLETDMVQLLQAKNSFFANLRVFEASNEALGSLLDISA